MTFIKTLLEDYDSEYVFPMSTTTLVSILIFILLVGGQFLLGNILLVIADNSVLNVMGSFGIFVYGVVIVFGFLGWIKKKKFGYYVTMGLGIWGLRQSLNNLTGGLPANEVGLFNTLLPAIFSGILMVLSQREHNRQISMLKKHGIPKLVTDDLSSEVIKPVIENNTDIKNRETLMNFNWKDVYFFMGLVVLAISLFALYVLYTEGLL